jgi:hypothetical protein
LRDRVPQFVEEDTRLGTVLWNFRPVLRDFGMSYGDYVEQTKGSGVFIRYDSQDQQGPQAVQKGRPAWPREHSRL